MRTREEIEKEHAACAILEGENWIVQPLMLEVLLDIRDMLNESQQNDLTNN